MRYIIRKLAIIGIIGGNIFGSCCYAVKSSEIVERYEIILETLEFQYTEKKFYFLLDRIDVRLDTYLSVPSISESKVKLLKKLKSVNSLKREGNGQTDNLAYTQDILSNENVSTINESRQKVLENTIRNTIGTQIESYPFSGLVEEFTQKGFHYIATNSEFEYLDGADIKRVYFQKYIPVDQTNYKHLLSQNTLLADQNTLVFDGATYYIPEGSIRYDTKQAYTRVASRFAGVIQADKNFFLEDNDTYYTYEFNSFVYFPDRYGFYEDELSTNNISVQDTILLIEENRYKIIKKYTKKKLISAGILEGIDDKEEFLKVVAQDARYTKNTDNDELFLSLKKESQILTSQGTELEKIQTIYNYILDKHFYYQDFKDGTQYIFSGIDTYENGYGVCDGYSKLMYYMLAFSGVDDIEQIRGYVIDAPDFPEIGHAWIRIGQYYYDPTFDDPIGGSDTLKSAEYRYFRLPKDIAYTNRVDGFTVENSLKSQSLTERKKLVETRLFGLLEHYNTSSYNLLKPFRVREQLGVGAGEDITLNTLKKKLPYFRVSEEFYYFEKNGTKKHISHMSYYVLTERNIDAIVSVLGEDILDATLFRWNLGNEKYEYRIAYRLTSK